MPQYTCFGLIFDSELELPELFPVVPPLPVADVQVRFSAFETSLPVPAEEGMTSISEAGARFYFNEIGHFLVHSGNTILIDRHAKASDHFLRLGLLGTAFSLLLHQRGLLVLHASGVAIGDAAVAFAADSGTGKSTTAAAFRGRGHRLISDDQVPVDLDARPLPLVAPGFPQLKLYGEAAAQLPSDNQDQSIELYPNYQKRGWRVFDGMIPRPLPLRRIYLLTDSQVGESIEPVPPGKAFAALVENSFLAGLLHRSGTQAHHFRQIARITNGLIPVKRLSRRRSLDLLPDVVRMVEQDLAQDHKACA